MQGLGDEPAAARGPPAMDNHAAATSHDAIPVRDREAPYAGMPGQTRFESVHLVQPDGSLRTLSVCRAINTRTHPELRERALAGQLHVFDDGRELALPFVYHDPDARKFALVLPAVLAHLELKEWSRLMAEIAEDTRHPVPLYVRDNTTVVGMLAFERYVVIDEEASEALPATDNSARSAAHDPLLSQRERELVEQERALIRMAETLTARENELGRQREQLETARVDLEIREQEIRDHGHRRGDWTEVGVSRPSEATLMAEPSRESLVANDGVMMPVRSHPPPLPQRPRTGPPPLPVRRMTPPPLAAQRHVEINHHHSEPPPLPRHAHAAPGEKDPEPEVAPPAYFAAQRVGQMAIKLVADELWLFVHIEESRAAAFRRSVDLLLQYAELEGYPVLVLSLVTPGEEPHAIRLALDGYAQTDLRVLEHLSRSFRARVALYIGGVYCETVTVAALREGVAQAISEELEKRKNERPSLSSSEAMMRVLHSPPPLWNDDLPFGPARREASTTALVAASVEQLSSWLRPEKLAEATLTYCVPRNVIDATIRRVLRSAVAFGIALPEDLAKLAVEHRCAPDETSLVRDQLQAFRQRVERGENDLGTSASRRNWERLLIQADALGLNVEEPTRTLAHSPSTPPSVPPPEAAQPARPLETLAAADIKLRLQSEEDRLEAIRELCARGNPAALEPVWETLPQLSEAELPGVLALLLQFGESAADGLISALTSPSQSLRQTAALALARLRLRRALLPMLKQLEIEEGPIVPELARAFGDFGPTALKTLVRVIPGTTRPDRLALALAHLANHGAAKDVEKLENNPHPEIAGVARKAMGRRSRLEWEDLAVRGQRTLGDSDPAALLSQAFYAEVTKVAI
jgi:hypothetical protein